MRTGISFSCCQSGFEHKSALNHAILYLFSSIMSSYEHYAADSVLKFLCFSQQVWKAEFVLADFMLHKMFTSSEIDGVVAVELGAGAG